MSRTCKRLIQRVMDGESMTQKAFPNGLLRAQPKVIPSICDVKTYVSCQEYDGILIKEHESI